MMSLNMPSVPFGKTPNGLTTSGLSPFGMMEIAPAANISYTAEETKLAWARAEAEFLVILWAGGLSIHWSSYPFSIQDRTHELFTKVLQKSAYFLTLPVAIGPEPAGSQSKSGSFNHSSSVDTLE
jgi:hypothetical protein